MAVTLEALATLYGASGTPLEGVSIDGLTLMMVPQEDRHVSIPNALPATLSRFWMILRSLSRDVLVRSLMLA